MIIIPVMKMRMIFIIGVWAAAVAASCGSEDDAGGGPRVVATTGIVADWVENVAGPDVEVVQLIPDGSSPHDFQLSAEDRLELEQAGLVAAVGAGLEAGVPLDESDGSRWELADNAGELLPFGEGGAQEHEGEDEEHAEEGEEHSEEGEEEHEHGASDPHIWMDPTRVAAALPSLAEALAETDPGGANDYRERARAYANELRSLDRELRRTLDTVPATNRELVTSHDSLGYLADRYGFEVVATAFPSSGPEADTSATQLQQVIDAIAEHGVPTVFAQEEDDPEALRLVADEAGVAIEEDLVIESPGSAGSYEEMLRRDAELISSGLDRG
jgi:ABC-type Zn uptake system ZnuABC Zn-binding protein ZnuA